MKIAEFFHTLLWLMIHRRCNHENLDGAIHHSIFAWHYGSRCHVCLKRGWQGHHHAPLRPLSIFFGVGSIGWTRTCSLSDFSTVREGYPGGGNWNWNNRQGPAIRLEGKRAIAFGSMLTTDRRYFLFKVLQSSLQDTNHPAIFSR